MSIEDEVKSLEKQLRTLQTKLEQLQKRLSKDSSPAISKSINGVTKTQKESDSSPIEKTYMKKSNRDSEKKKSHDDPVGRRRIAQPSSQVFKQTKCVKKENRNHFGPITTSHTQDRRTLRSRSFKVMRHLINMVDQSLIETSVNTQLNTPDQQRVRSGNIDLPRSSMEIKKPIVSKQTETFTTSSDESIKLYRYRSIPKYTKIYRSKIKNEGSEQLAENNDISVEDIIQLYIPKVPPTDKKERYYYSGYATKKMGYCSAPDLSTVPHKIMKKLRDPSFAWYKDRWMLISRPEP
ncbi:hypothetical protein PGT21_019799 [Puccinia graminis f. sp. tritici]|uniref:Uncharacterized protein n=2 Tax=Puccinia graminis f. sp. tritici TaxID=56615 RepID=H6QP70_PUCGT|nr:uncharacterized protein PGTG_20739 [Puccinia graminis f. sp. tritici CRL 75-36-700-3]EHS63155.1 hypothetical protein PGTG_20739 [Puccinia graminis f. sp. tritici CRL 75-36-700-3]KAA1073603.1 hypothetical protein PGT21_017522 [Puccinia graminis f. sp. tritici]KAA1073641.1 hypothetical protein PGT21_019799 [Puccinia graminis f. sp. tritici]